ncbi:hypothetical protein SSABA_v1c00730 [Spiroplasma sabaudiense Ar-1343]|uniref:EAL domain-containing protein n=1 Tax=Spiroplasma sabaudiense Ar-1343 TaxID=1276257 RepID=W6A9C0_9MOLU|nr:EAL domain-containing protein [Spiroplasma sabaudiense]AHI53485.1 hypothetical protein SSABA_v1c00730 [Spiroplasma sabaudiense Ar-1343]
MSQSIWVIIAICSAFVVFATFFYALTFGLTRHLFFKIKVYYDIIIGILYGMLSVIMSVIIKTRSFSPEITNLAIFLSILVFGLSLMFNGYTTGFIVLGLNLVSILVMPFWFPKLFHGITSDYILTLIIVSYSVITLMAILKKYIKKINNWWVWSIFSLAVISVGTVFILAEKFDFEQIEKILLLSSWILTGYLCFGTFTVIDSVYKHALKLRNIIAYDQNRYVLETGANAAITEYISKNKISYGLFVNYYIGGFDKFEKKVSGRVRDYIVQNISGQAIKKFQDLNDKTLFFKSSFKLFGAFIPLEEIEINKVQIAIKNNQSLIRSGDDILLGVQDAISKIVTDFKIDNHLISVKLLASASIYGIHSNDIEQLQTFNRYLESAVVRGKNVNKILLIDPIEFNFQKNQNRKLLALNEIVDLNQCSNSFEPIFSRDNNNLIGFHLNNQINLVNITDNANKKTLETINEAGLESLFNRFLSFENLKSIRQHKVTIVNKKVFINYDQWIVSSEDFSIKQLVKKINSFQLKDIEIVFVFDIRKEISAYSTLEENINLIKKNKIQIALEHFGSKNTNYELISRYQPDFVIMDEEIIHKLGNVKAFDEIFERVVNIANKIEAKMIFKGIDNYTIFKKIQKQNADLIWGKLLGESRIPKPNLAEETLFLLNKKV